MSVVACHMACGLKCLAEVPGRLGAPGTRVGAELEARESQTPLQGEFLCPVLIEKALTRALLRQITNPGGQSGGEEDHTIIALYRDSANVVASREGCG